MNVKKWHQSEICIVINDKSQGSIAKNLKSYESLYYTFIIQSTSERIFKIDEHLAKLQAKWLIASYAPFDLDFCLQRYRTHWISEITCGVTMGWLLRLVTGGPTGGRGPRQF